MIDVIGEGGFGIVYRAYDELLHRVVAIKEFMPAAMANRITDKTVAVKSERYEEAFEAARRSFINEARLLAQFDHPSLVKVYRFWEANGTAYMAMPFYEGTTLKGRWRRTQAASPTKIGSRTSSLRYWTRWRSSTTRPMLITETSRRTTF